MEKFRKELSQNHNTKVIKIKLTNKFKMQFKARRFQE